MYQNVTIAGQIIDKKGCSQWFEFFSFEICCTDKIDTTKFNCALSQEYQ